jgi:hypothetical protein
VRPAGDDDRRLQALHAQQGSHPRAQQHAGLARDDREDLRRRRLARNEDRHTLQRRVLTDELL